MRKGQRHQQQVSRVLLTAQKERRAVVRVACEEPDALRETVLEVGLAVMQRAVERFPESGLVITSILVCRRMTRTSPLVSQVAVWVRDPST